MMENDRPKEACGVFGVYGHEAAAELTYLGLYALQHRGEESAGIVAANGKEAKSYMGMGLVVDVFGEKFEKSLPGHLSIGHVRYSTRGSPVVRNIQPFLVDYAGGGPLAVAHNGNLLNFTQLRSRLEASGSVFQSTTDSEIIIHLIAQSRKKNFEEKIIHSISQLKGAYSFVFLTRDMIIAARDPCGFRPLCLGKIDNAYIIASETCALDLIGAEYLRDVEPGEIIFIDKNGLHPVKPFPEKKHSFCIFEYIYFARPDSNIFGGNVCLTRKMIGQKMAAEMTADGDLVVPVPDSANYAALGFAEGSGLPFEMGMVRNHYIGRTFIQPVQLIRDFQVRVKLNPIKSLFREKRVIVIDDSIVRGTTGRTRMNALRQAGAREVHLRISCPPHRFPCYYGIDFQAKGELIASSREIEEIRRHLGVDSLEYLSLDGLLEAMPVDKREFCTACFNADYPLKPIPDEEITKHG